MTLWDLIKERRGPAGGRENGGKEGGGVLCLEIHLIRHGLMTVRNYNVRGCWTMTMTFLENIV